MTRVTFLFALVGGALAQNLPFPYLEFAYDALEPWIPEEIMRLHHLGHHATYTERTNAILGELRGQPSTNYLVHNGIEYIMQNLYKVPIKWRTNLRNNGGGYLNHEFFWKMLTPSRLNGTEHYGGHIDEKTPLAKVLIKHFNSIEGFKKSVKELALTVFGSGWVWLELDVTGGRLRLILSASANQDGPYSKWGRVPIFALDVWEHAYYLKYKHRRGDYIDAFWNVFNFEEANLRYIATLQKHQLDGPPVTVTVEPMRYVQVESEEGPANVKMDAEL